MKCFAVLIFGLLTERSFATENDCHFLDKVNTDFLLQKAKESLNLYPLPSIEYGDQMAAAFTNNYTDSFLDYIGFSFGILYHQAQERGKELVDAILKDYYRLKRSIESIKDDESDPMCLEDDLKMLIEQLCEFLDLLPGNLAIKQPMFTLPVLRTDLNSRSEKRSDSELFLNLCPVFDDVLSSLYGLVTALWLDAIGNGRKYMNIAQTQHRNEILNDFVMDKYRHVVEEVFERGETVQCHVEPTTWDSFRNAANRIIRISNDYKASKDDSCE